MKAFNWYLSEVRRNFPFHSRFTALIQAATPKGEFLPDMGTLYNLLRGEGRPDLAESVEASGASADAIASMGVITFIEKQILDHGPKVYAPTTDQLDALLNTHPNFAIEDYRQPFNTFCMAVPDDFPWPHTGVNRPAVVVGHDTPVNSKGERSITMVFCEDRRGAALPPGLTVRGGDMFLVWSPHTKFTIHQFKDGTDISTAARYLAAWAGMKDEFGLDVLGRAGVVDALARLGAAYLNACMALTGFGAVHKGKANPLFEADLRRSLAKKKLPDKVRAACERDLKLLPDLYGFDQSVRLFDREGGEPGEGGSGREMTTHWRRGHWTRQPCGVGRADRKMLFRKPCLVRADRFVGDHSATTATYRGATP